MKPDDDETPETEEDDGFGDDDTHSDDWGEDEVDSLCRCPKRHTDTTTVVCVYCGQPRL